MKKFKYENQFEETHAARMRRFTSHGSFEVVRAETTSNCGEHNLVRLRNRNEKRPFEKLKCCVEDFTT